MKQYIVVLDDVAVQLREVVDMTYDEVYGAARYDTVPMPPILLDPEAASLLMRLKRIVHARVKAGGYDE